MARVTVEDCVTKIPNRFSLVLCASQRARQISSGSTLFVERDRDKNPVVALREIATEYLKPEELREEIIHGLQKHAEVDEPEEDDLSLMMSGEQQEGEKAEPGAKTQEKDIQQENLEQQTLENSDESTIIEPEDE